MIIMFWAFQHYIKPFLPSNKNIYRPNINKLEERYLISSVFILLSGIAFNNIDDATTFYKIYGWIIAVLIVCLSIYFFIPTIKELYNQLEMVLNHGDTGNLKCGALLEEEAKFNKRLAFQMGMQYFQLNIKF